MEDGTIEFVGIYDADATIVGEISYWIGARFGRRHCALCDLTHGLFTVRSEWRSCSASLGVPFLAFHRDDAPADALAAAAGTFPVVLARTDDGLRVLLDRSGLEQFDGSTERFVAWLRDHRGAGDPAPHD